YDQPNQELLLCLLPLAKRLTEGSLHQASRSEMTAIVEQLQNLAEPLRPRAELLMDKICFCEGVKRFGVYMPLPEDHAFQAATARSLLFRVTTLPGKGAGGAVTGCGGTFPTCRECRHVGNVPTHPVSASEATKRADGPVRRPDGPGWLADAEKTPTPWKNGPP